MFDTTTLELIAIIVAAGAAAGISVSLASRNRKTVSPRILDNQAKSESSEPISTPNFASESETDLLDIDSEPSQFATVQQTQEQISESAPPFESPVVSSFQAAVPQDEISERINGKETVSSEGSTIEQPNAVFREPIPPETAVPESSSQPKADEIPFKPSSSDEFSSVATSSIAVPTDSAAIGNIGQAPFPIAPQTVSISGVVQSPAGTANSGMPSAYCVKCKSKKQMKDPTQVTMKNGRPAVSGFCSDCGTRVFRIGKIPSTF